MRVATTHLPAETDVVEQVADDLRHFGGWRQAIEQNRFGDDVVDLHAPVQ